MPRGETKHLKRFQFKPGQSGNPDGGKKHDPIKKVLKNLTIETYREVIEAVLTGNLENLKEMIENPKTSVLQVGIAKAIVRAVKEGDYEIIERIAERIVGKIPDELNLHSTNKNFNANAKVPVARVKEALAKLYEEI